MTGNDRSLDVLGIKPVADAALVVTKGSVEGAGAFLSRICLPAAEEFGLLLRDKVRGWRATNAAKIAAKAETKLAAREQGDRLHAHPRIVGHVLENGSWEDNDQVQSMWAGLLASSCTEDGQSQQNLLFVNLLEQITRSQAILLNHACEHTRKSCSRTGLIITHEYRLSMQDIVRIMGADDHHMADVELDHLREIGLLTMDSGFDLHQDDANIQPSALGLNFYVRCQGYVGSPLDYFGVVGPALSDEGGESTDLKE